MIKLSLNVFVLFSFLILSFYSVEQSRIDSLKIELKNEKNDSIKCDILSELVYLGDDNEWPKYNLDLKQLCESKLLYLKVV